MEGLIRIIGSGGMVACLSCFIIMFLYPRKFVAALLYGPPKNLWFTILTWFYVIWGVAGGFYVMFGGLK